MGYDLNTTQRGKAAFYDLDGTLLSCNLVTTYAYYARNDRSIFHSIYRLTKVLLNVPAFLALDLYSRTLFNLFFFRVYQGMHRDRLIGLADDLFEVTLKPSIYPKSYELLRSTLEQGYRNVLVTGALDFTVRPIALHFGFKEIICNRLEFKEHIATGRVLPPLVAEAQKAVIIRDYAAKEGIDLSQSCAFSDSTSDLPMLTVTGQPVATNPTRRLHRVASRNGWPIISLAGDEGRGLTDGSNSYPPPPRSRTHLRAPGTL
ncbi:MAG: HAD-IB family hydrolase [Acidobacteria bacterium]|nr:HAD-IB family hydrolase [Acidobacteriota bacterium]